MADIESRINGGVLEAAVRLPVRPGAPGSLPRLARTGEAQARLRARGLSLSDLAALAALAGFELADPVLSGRVGIEAELGGTLDDPEIKGTVELADVRLGERQRLDGRLVLETEAKHTSLTASADLGGHPLLRLSAKLGAGPGDVLAFRRSVPRERVLRAPLSATASVRGLELQELGELHRRLEGLGGRASLQLELRGTAERPEAELELTVADARRGQSRIGDIDAALRVMTAEAETEVKAEIFLGTLPLARLAGRVELLAGELLRGRAPLDRAVSATATIPPYPISSFALLWEDEPSLEGTVSGSASLEGTLARPAASAELALAGARVEDVALEEVSASASYLEGRLTASLLVSEPAAGRLTGRLELDLPADDLRLLVDARSIDLAFLAPFVPLRALGGELSVRLEASGALREPAVRGQLIVQDGTVGFTRLPPLTGITLQAEISESSLILKRLFVPVQGGHIDVRGAAAMRGIKPSSFELTATASSVPLTYVNLSDARFDATARVSGRLDDEGLRSVAKIEDAVLRLARLPGVEPALHPVGPLPDVRFVESRQALRAPPRLVPDQPRPTRLPFELAIVANEVLVRGREVSASFATSLTVKTTEKGEVILVGAINAKEGSIELFKRRYQVERAVVSFDGQRPPDPALDVRLSHAFPDATVILEMGGSLRAPELELASDPPTFDRGQVISLVLTGSPGVGGIEQRTASPYALASAVLQLTLGRLAERVVPFVGIDVVRIEQVETERAETLHTEELTRIELGKFVTDRIYIGYRRIFGAGEGENSNEGLVLYTISPSWSLETEFGDAGVGGLDLFWTHWY